jgi:nicotinamide riboside transporter PnuC
MKYYRLDWIGTILGLASIHYPGRKNKTGFILRIVASAFKVAFGIIAETPAGIVANLAVIILSFRGLHQWKVSEKTGQ